MEAERSEDDDDIRRRRTGSGEALHALHAHDGEGPLATALTPDMPCVQARILIDPGFVVGVVPLSSKAFVIIADGFTRRNTQF